MFSAMMELGREFRGLIDDLRPKSRADNDNHDDYYYSDDSCDDDRGSDPLDSYDPFGWGEPYYGRRTGFHRRGVGRRQHRSVYDGLTDLGWGVLAWVALVCVPLILLYLLVMVL